MEKIDNFLPIRKKVLEIMQKQGYIVGELRISFSIPKQAANIKLVKTERRGDETIICTKDL